MDDLSQRIAEAGADLIALRSDLLAGEPWPLSATYGTEPEADWGPREVLAHVNEMLAYWTSELTQVVAGDGSGGPVSFGRVASDPVRLARIAADRERPAGELLDAIATNIEATTGFIEPGALERVGEHPTRGEITVAASLDRFIASHLEDHVRQLRSILADAPAR
jgi:hypothetical protein